MINDTGRKAFEQWADEFRTNYRPFNPDEYYIAKLAWQSALAQREQVGEWVMVPREPTSEMINAANYGYENGEVIGPVSMYAAMLSAAPAPSLCTAEEAAENLPYYRSKLTKR